MKEHKSFIFLCVCDPAHSHRGLRGTKTRDYDEAKSPLRSLKRKKENIKTKLRPEIKTLFRLDLCNRSRRDHDHTLHAVLPASPGAGWTAYHSGRSREGAEEHHYY